MVDGGRQFLSKCNNHNFQTQVRSLFFTHGTVSTNGAIMNILCLILELQSSKWRRD